MKKVNYKVILVLWLALGIGYGGYKQLHPERVIVRDWGEKITPRYDYGDSKVFKDIYLITLVGSILIGGLGYLLKRKN